MRPSFTPPALLFWVYVALSIFSTVLLELSDGGTVLWWGIPITAALVYGLYRGLMLAWWFLLVFDSWGVFAVVAIQPESGSLNSSEMAFIAISFTQVVVLMAIRVAANPSGRPADGPRY